MPNIGNTWARLRKVPLEVITGRPGNTLPTRIITPMISWEKCYNEPPKAWTPSTATSMTIQVQVMMTGLRIRILHQDTIEERCPRNRIQRNGRETLAIGPKQDA